MLWLALAPALSHLLAIQPDVDQTEVCSSSGYNRGALVETGDSGDLGHVLKHCVLCLTGVDHSPLAAGWSAADLWPVAASQRVLGVSLDNRPRLAWTLLPSRAPPQAHA